MNHSSPNIVTAKSVYFSALEIADSEERARFLKQVCNGDFTLRAEVEQLLSTGSVECSGLFAHAISKMNPEVGFELPDTDSHAYNSYGRFELSSHPIVDRYKLLEEIGRGGMGTVYMAQQLEPVKRRVALKVINPGMDSREVIARFEAERQALAMMDHPNIARVFDGGTTGQGRPYFVMELVRGIPITEYSEKHKLLFNDRLHLFVDVCQAVQHAHQKGIIHRDLKPSNVQITNRDGTPMVKVIDFGVAKALHQDLTKRTLYTQFSQLVGTPLYMSPEQADRFGIDIDTRSDVYSLGVLLYELLTGTTPFDREEISKVGVEAARRIICEVEPPRPSVRVSTLKAADDSTLEARRAQEAVFRQREFALRGDLDWIVMKALEKDRNARYESASALAQDIQRHLDSEPIEARPPTTATRLAKWSRRHEKMVWATVLTSMMVAAVLGVSATLLAHSRNEARLQANMATQEKLEAIRNLYRANVQVAYGEWQHGRVDRALLQLAQIEPNQGEEDHRHWEWYFVNALCHQGDILDGYLIKAPPECPVRLLARVNEDSTVFTDLRSGKIALSLNRSCGYCRLAPNGSAILFHTKYGLEVYDLATRSQLWNISNDPELVEWSPRGDRVLMTQGAGSAAILDATTGAKLVELEKSDATGYDSGADWSKDGNLVAVGSSGGKLRIWDAHSGKLLHVLTVPQTDSLREDPVWAVAWDPKGRRIATAGRSYLWIWNLADHEIERTIKAHRGPIEDIAWSPEGESIITSGLADSIVKIWNAETGEEENEFRGHTSMIYSVAWLDNGRALATKSNERGTIIWQAAEQSQPHALPLRGALGWTPAGALVSARNADNESGCFILNTSSQTIESKFVNDSWKDVYCLAIDSKNRRVATGHKDGRLKIWDLQTCNLQHDIKAFPYGLRCIAWNPSGAQLVVSGGNSDTPFRVFDADNGQEVTKLIIKDDRHATYGGIAWSPDGALIAGYHIRVLQVWRTDRWTQVMRSRTGDGGDAEANGVSWSPNGDRFATATGELVNIWDAKSMRLASRIRAHIRETGSVAWSPDGSRIATGGDDHLIKIWDPETGQDMLTLEGHTGAVSYLAWSPDGRMLASSNENETLLWDATKGYVLQR